MKSFLVIPLLLLTSISSVNATNSGDFSGAVAIGTSYAGTVTAPTNGLSVQGNVGIGTSSPTTTLDVNGGINGKYLKLNQTPTPFTPGGRLTLSANTPVMTSDVTGASTVYYADYANDLVPIYDGTNWIQYPLGGQISLALDSNSGHTGYQQSGKNFDTFVGINAGSPALCTGPAWSSDTARGTGAGTTEIQMLNGIWTNKNSMTCRYGSASGDTFSCAANQCTLVGSMRATANGQATHKCFGNVSNGGSMLGISNAYNLVPISCIETDSTSGWNYTTANVWRAARGNSSNVIATIFSLPQSPVSVSYTQNAAAAGNGVEISVGFDSTTTPQAAALSQLSSYIQLFINSSSAPTIGFHNYYALEYCGNSGPCLFGIFGASYRLTLDTTY